MRLSPHKNRWLPLFLFTLTEDSSTPGEGNKDMFHQPSHSPVDESPLGYPLVLGPTPGANRSANWPSYEEGAARQGERRRLMKQDSLSTNEHDRRTPCLDGQRKVSVTESSVNSSPFIYPTLAILWPDCKAPSIQLHPPQPGLEEPSPLSQQPILS